MRHGAIHGETNSCPKAIHARQGNSLAIGRDASPIFVDGNGGHPERDVEAPSPTRVRGKWYDAIVGAIHESPAGG